MMTVIFHFGGQLARVAGGAGLTLEIPDGTTLGEAVEKAAERHGADFRALVQTPEGAFPTTLFAAVGGVQIRDAQAPLAGPVAEIFLMTPMAGG